MYVNRLRNYLEDSELHSRRNLELLTPEAMKLLGNLVEKITKNKNGENVTQIEIPKVILVHCDIVNINTSMTQGICLNLFQISHSTSY